MAGTCFKENVLPSHGSEYAVPVYSLPRQTGLVHTAGAVLHSKDILHLVGIRWNICKHANMIDSTESDCVFSAPHTVGIIVEHEEAGAWSNLVALDAV